MALVSVALSTYNGERYLREQLDSVLAQVGVELEIVAVDDGSTDGTRSILDEFAARDARPRWSANPANLGPTRTFERSSASFAFVVQDAHVTRSRHTRRASNFSCVFIR